MMKLLVGHDSPATAFVVEDYPYGFRLRCKMRYWLEFNRWHGMRLVTQTSNPKKPGLFWNKPKNGTYSKFGAALYLDDAGHVRVTGLTEYTNGAEAADWAAKYGDSLPAAARDTLDRWVRAKVAYDANREKADPLHIGLPEAVTAFLTTPKEEVS